MNKKQIIILAVALVIGVAIGLAVTALLKGSKAPSVITEPTPEDSVAVERVDEQNSESSAKKEDTTPAVTSVPEPVEENVKPDDKGSAVSNGKQTDDGKKKPAFEPMTAAELQRLILNHDKDLQLNRHAKVARKVSLTIQGMRDGERKPQAFIDVMSKLEPTNEYPWASVRVTSVGHDKDGRLVKATIVAVYANNDND